MPEPAQAGVGALARRVILFRGSREAVPLFALYALLFADHGLSTAQIGLLLAVWSVSSFVLEVPSGSWADLVDRRRLLVASGLVYAGGFATWLVWPSYPGFLTGFVLWSLSSALMSGTFEAYLFDELTAAGRPDLYGPLRSRAESLAVLVMAASIGVAGPLYAVGGYPLVGWVSVGLALLHTSAAVALPRVTARRATAEVPAEGPASVRSWLRTVRTGAAEAGRSRSVRAVLLAYGSVVALVGFDEFFPLVLEEGGAPVRTIAGVLAGISLLQAAGTWAAGRVARLTGTAHAALVAVGGLLLAAGVWWTGPVSYAALAVGYALTSAAYVAGDVRLQHAITGDARATTTSVAGVVAELGFLLTLGVVALATLRFDLAPVSALAALCLTVPAAIAAYRAPGA
ncbi:MFS transporter [Ornithinimicrobium cavernae]|uniref:MFS transporter n=1 Tax=Ornithinimicrobium cavernae TaxID=2666047 RepID=UPI000D690B58|nr:MFS transporter [Ornithinimicrobium cavernae]